MLDFLFKNIRVCVRACVRCFKCGLDIIVRLFFGVFVYTVGA